MNPKEILIICNGKDNTDDIVSYKENDFKDQCEIVYKSGKIYNYHKTNVEIFRDPISINIENRAVYVGESPVFSTESMVQFQGEFVSYIKIFQSNGNTAVYPADEIKIIENGVTSESAKNILAYWRDIAHYVKNPDDKDYDTFLGKLFDELTFVHPESILGKYINREPIEKRTTDLKNTIFPVEFNLSQKSALENALTNSISVVEGPPGTGKTQTIVNIIANLIAVQRKTVAMVSFNNEAVRNVKNKLEKQGYGFLIANLGNNSNKKLFFSDMPKIDVTGWDCTETQADLQAEINRLNSKLDYLFRINNECACLKQELAAYRLEQEHFEKYYAKQSIDEISELPFYAKSANMIVSFLADAELANQLGQSERLLFRIKLLFKYGIFNIKKLQPHEITFVLRLQRMFYQKKIHELDERHDKLMTILDESSFEILCNEHQKKSEKLFRKLLYETHNNLTDSNFTQKNYLHQYVDFLKRFPLILSTNHSIRNSMPENFIFDYLIIDEASQVDLLTSALAFSCCRNVIIVGDLKQLAQIVDETIEERIKTKDVDACYNYFQHNILSSIIELYGNNLPRIMLREHYRCHPKIIEFCNQKYYGGRINSIHRQHHIAKSIKALSHNRRQSYAQCDKSRKENR